MRIYDPNKDKQARRQQGKLSNLSDRRAGKRRLKRQRPPKRAGGRRLQRVSAAISARLRARRPLPQSAGRRRWRNRIRPLQSVTFNIREILYSARWISFALLCACLYAFYLIGANPRFYVNNIDIDGAQLIDTEELIRASSLRGAHIFALEPDKLAADISNFPGILEAEVQLSWPDQLHIAIKEDTPVLRWQEAGESYWVNSQGTLVPAGRSDVELVTVVADLPRSRLQQFGRDEVGDLAVIREAVPVSATYLEFIPQDVIAAALAIEEEFEDVTTLQFETTAGLQLVDPSGVAVKFGVSGDMALKVAIYRAIAADLQQRGVIAEYIDVSVVDKPVYKPVTPVEQE